MSHTSTRSSSSDPSPASPVAAVLLAASALTVMAAAVVVPSLPMFLDQFRQVPGAALWVRQIVVLPALFVVLGAPLAGILTDRIGARPVLIASALAYAAAGSSGLWLDSLAAILAGRAALGLAVAGVMTAATALIAELFTGAARTRMLSAQAAVIGAVGAMLIAGGGALSEAHWRVPFVLYLVAVPIALGVAITTRARTASAAKTVPSAAPAASAGHDASILPIVGTIFLANILFYIVPIHLPFVAETMGLGRGTASGLLLSVMTGSYAIGSLLSSRLTAGMRFGRAAAIGYALVAMGLAVTARAAGVPVMVAGLMSIGIGSGLVVPAANVMIARLARNRGRAMSAIVTATFAGQFVSPLMTQPLLAYGARAPFVAGALLAMAFAVIAASASLMPPRALRLVQPV